METDIKLFRTDSYTYTLSHYDMDWGKEYFIYNQYDEIKPSKIIEILAETHIDDILFHIQKDKFIRILYHIQEGNHSNIWNEIANI